ncbi:MAG: glycosyltransferase [Chitinophagaceae bacterium]|nr:MAG: glycosyltransferase [Chitinophagaceae bacterium]
MLIITVIAAFLFTGYSILILTYWWAWRTVPSFTASGEPSTRVSIVIPVRNEEANIGNLLAALQEQVYPPGLLEIIVVDDHSEDATVQVIRKFEGIKLVSLPDQEINSYKKKSIETGIAAAGGELIITTDADCIPSPGWLHSMVRFYETSEVVFIAAPVRFTTDRTILAMFQAMDFMVLQGITAASVHKKIHAMCNGANMAYTRKVFYEVDGFRGIDHIASGDDMLLMYKIRQRYPDKVKYLRAEEAIMFTSPQETLRSFINQRIRWASKATSYQEKNMLPVLALVYFFNLLFPALIIAAFWNPRCWLLAATLWVGKTIIEMPFYWSVSGFYRMRWSAALLFFFQPLHIVYTIVSGFLGQFRTYEWKGRKVS